MILQNLRYAVRQLRNSPGFALVAVLTLALGIGANTAIFSVMNAVLLRNLPVPNPQELFYLHVPDGQPAGAGNTGNSETSFSDPVFEQLRQDHRAFADVIAFVPLSILGKTAVRIGSTPEEAEGDMVSGNFFFGLQVPLYRGRGFTLDDERNHTQVAVLSYSFWAHRFSRDPSVVGRTLYVKGVPFAIIGIAPQRFYGVEPGRSTDFWIPLQNRHELNAWGVPPENNTLYGTPTWWCLEVIVRLAPGVSSASALAEVMPSFQRVAYTGLSTPDPRSPKAVFTMVPGRGIEGLSVDSTSRDGVLILMALVIVVLVIACTNVAMLFVAKKSSRHREFGLRLALGASRFQIFGQLLLESALLAGSGAALGWLFAVGATHALAAWSQMETGLEPDGTVLLFTLGVSATAALIFGLAPLFQMTSQPAAMALKTGLSSGHHTRATRWRGAIVMAAQTTLCFVLLVAAGLLLRTLRNYESTDLGMRAQGLLVFGITPQKSADTAQNQRFYDALLARLRTLPGVESATAMESRLGSGWSDNNSVVLDGVRHNFDDAPLRSNTVGTNFFHVLGVPLLAGRDISDHDTAGSEKVAVVNETFARRLLPGRDAIGHQIGDKIRFTIIGVARDFKYTSVNERPQPMAFYAYAQAGGVAHMEVAVRTSGNAAAVLPSIQGVIQEFDPNVPLENPMSQQAVFEDSYSLQRMFSRLSSFFGLLAAFLIAVGLYGTLAYRVTRRTAEIGLRMALGADRANVLRMMLGESLAIAIAGLSVGLLAALLSAGIMRSLLFGLEPRDPVTFCFAFGAVLLVTLCAGFLPACRAASIQPMQALHVE